MKIKIEKLIDRLAQFNIGEHTVVIISMAVVIGLLSGFANVLFRAAIHFVHEVVFVGGSELLNINKGGYYRLLLPLLPVCGALLLIPLSLMFKGEVNGYGFPKFLERVNIKGGRIKRRTVPLKIISSALTIGTGGSAGVEGPIAQIGGAIGSFIGQLFKVSGNRIKLLIRILHLRRNLQPASPAYGLPQGD